MAATVLLLAGILLLGAGDAAAFEGESLSLATGGGRLSKSVRTFKDIREAGVVLQNLDYSCGAAAMATLLTGYFDDEVSEDEIVGFIFVHGQTPDEAIKKYFRRQGFSLLDLKRFAVFRGYSAAGYKEMTTDDLLETLEKDEVPILVPISPMGYHHFVVVRGIVGDRVFLADPAVGRTTMRLGNFLDAWVDGIGFIVTREGPPAVASRLQSTDEELAQMTAAGAPGAPIRTAKASANRGSILLVGKDEPFIDNLSLLNAFRRESPHRVQKGSPTFSTTGPVNDHIVTVYDFKNFDPVIQFGDPAGNWVDFSRATAE